jgi:hypothetical protein
VIPVGTMCIIVRAAPRFADFVGRFCTVTGHDPQEATGHVHILDVSNWPVGVPRALGVKARRNHLLPITPPPNMRDEDTNVPRKEPIHEPATR